MSAFFNLIGSTSLGDGNDDDDDDDTVLGRCLGGGRRYRRFDRAVDWCGDPEWNEVLTLAYRHVSTEEPSRAPSNFYRNHFCAYVSSSPASSVGFEKRVLIVRSQTTLVLSDQDVSLDHYEIRLADGGVSGSCCDGRWLVSYDECGLSIERPDNLDDYTLCCSGEWWYFDRGLILTGGVCDSYENPSQCLIYMEFRKTNSRRSCRNADDRPQPPVISGDGVGTGDRAQPIPLPEFSRILTESGRRQRFDADDVVRSNDNAGTSESTAAPVREDRPPLLEALKTRADRYIPAPSWLAERDSELKRGYPNYFIPEIP